MYPLSITQPYRGLLYGLLILWAALLILGFAFGPLNEARTNRIPLANRMASSFILVVCGLIWWWGGARSTELASCAVLILGGITFGFLGDLTLAQIIPTPDPPGRIIFGIGIFGVGHIFYIIAFLKLGNTLGLTNGLTRAVSLAALLAVGVIVWWGWVRSPQAPALLNYGSLGYALLMAVMVGLAVALAAQDIRLVPLAIGVALFMLSDIVLGNELFRDNIWFLVGDVVWTIYIVGQALIVFSSAISLRLLGSGG